MKIQFNSYKQYKHRDLNYSRKPSFKASAPVETIKHCNIGMMPNGLIGKIRVTKANGEEAFLNVFKDLDLFSEIYYIRDNAERPIGYIKLRVRKSCDNDSLFSSKEQGHVFVETLRNFSNPKTPYYIKDLEEYKNIGTRLMQIAQRRSDEANCNGNIELISKDESLAFYHKLGFQNVKTFWGGNPNKMYLPPDAKEPFSKKYGGL
jgi:hypothetical protein